MAKNRVAILGAGTGGTIVANRLRRRFSEDELEIHVVDRDNRHVYQPGLLFVPFGHADPEEIVRPRGRQLRTGIAFHERPVEAVSLAEQRVELAGGKSLPYDLLVVASGAELQPEETDGLLGAGWLERVFTFYDLEGATALRGALERFAGGRLVVNLVDMPIKCPVAPLEFAFLVDCYLRECVGQVGSSRPIASAEFAAPSTSSTRRRSTAPSRSRSRPSGSPGSWRRRRSSS